MEIVNLGTPHGIMPLLVCRPADGGPHPGVVVIREIFGVSAHIQSVAQRLAEVGYLAVVPDAFYRTGLLQVVLPPEVEAAIRITRAGANHQGIMSDLQAVVSWLASQGSRHVGVVGFSLGGREAFRAAAEVSGLSAAGVFYGGGLVPSPGLPALPGPSGLELAPRLRCPIISFWGGQDKRIPREHVRQLEEAVDQSSQTMDVHWYEQADRGFCCEDGPSYNETAARAAWPKLLRFFKQHLTD